MQLCTVRVKHFTGELHLGRTKRVVWWKYQLCRKDSTLETGSLRSTENYIDY